MHYRYYYDRHRYRAVVWTALWKQYAFSQAEDAVCLADYCDIMRCDILRKQIMSEPGEGPQVNTDIEIWREATAYHTALSPTGPRELARVTPPSFRPPQPPQHRFVI